MTKDRNRIKRERERDRAQKCHQGVILPGQKYRTNLLCPTNQPHIPTTIASHELYRSLIFQGTGTAMNFPALFWRTKKVARSKHRRGALCRRRRADAISSYSGAMRGIIKFNASSAGWGKIAQVFGNLRKARCLINILQ